MTSGQGLSAKLHATLHWHACLLAWQHNHMPPTRLHLISCSPAASASAWRRAAAASSLLAAARSLLATFSRTAAAMPSTLPCLAWAARTRPDRE